MDRDVIRLIRFGIPVLVGIISLIVYGIRRAVNSHDNFKEDMDPKATDTQPQKEPVPLISEDNGQSSAAPETSNNKAAPAKRSKATTVFMALFIFFAVLSQILLICTAIGLFRYNELKSKYDESRQVIERYRSDIDDVNRKLNQTKNELSDTRDLLGKVSAIMPFAVSDIQMGNLNGSQVINDFGTYIYSSDTYYLHPKIKYTGLKSTECTLYIKLFRPDGTLSHNDNSPAGYSYTERVNLQTGEHELKLSGWGGKDRGHWTRGTYIIEIWYDNRCLKRKSFNIY